MTEPNKDALIRELVGARKEAKENALQYVALMGQLQEANNKALDKAATTSLEYGGTREVYDAIRALKDKTPIRNTPEPS